MAVEAQGHKHAIIPGILTPKALPGARDPQRADIQRRRRR